MDEDDIRRIPPDQIHSDESVRELMDSPDMKPYARLAMAELKGQDIEPQLQAIRELPLDRRYIWRVASALKWAFADFDTVNVEVDRDSLSDQDLITVLKMLEHRPMQFCMFFSALVGPEEMQRRMAEAVEVAKNLGG